jgi:hypothetical protein
VESAALARPTGSRPVIIAAVAVWPRSRADASGLALAKLVSANRRYATT